MTYIVPQKIKLTIINAKIICIVKETNATMKGFKPNPKILLNEIFKPIPAIATIKRNLLILVNNNKILSGIKLNEANIAIIRKPITKNGIEKN